MTAQPWGLVFISGRATSIAVGQLLALAVLKNWLRKWNWTGRFFSQAELHCPRGILSGQELETTFEPPGGFWNMK